MVTVSQSICTVTLGLHEFHTLKKTGSDVADNR